LLDDYRRDEMLMKAARFARNPGAVILILGWVSVSLSQSSGTISTVTGTGSCGFSGDGGPASSAKVNGPNGLATDRAGHLYIADVGNHVVRKVTPTGMITTFAGTGAPGFDGDNQPAGKAQLATPAGVAVDLSGRYLYIADNGNHRIRRIDLLTLTIITVAGTGQPGFGGDGGAATQAQLAYPSAVALDLAGNLYIADTGNYRIRRVDSSGIIRTFAGTGLRAFCGDGGPALLACFVNPVALAAGPTGEVFIADSSDHRVRRVDPNGMITTVAGNGHFGAPTPGPATQTRIKWPQGLATDSVGNLFISDFATHLVMRVDRSAMLTFVAGTGTAGFNGDGGPATRAMLNGPSGIVIDSAGTMFISDSQNCRVRRVR
jgi:DNA-binding beta-propeller fold protein YncE